jgi:hypothetical protein
LVAGAATQRLYSTSGSDALTLPRQFPKIAYFLAHKPEEFHYIKKAASILIDEADFFDEKITLLGGIYLVTLDYNF